MITFTILEISREWANYGPQNDTTFGQSPQTDDSKNRHVIYTKFVTIEADFQKKAMVWKKTPARPVMSFRLSKICQLGKILHYAEVSQMHTWSSPFRSYICDKSWKVEYLINFVCLGKKIAFLANVGYALHRKRLVILLQSNFQTKLYSLFGNISHWDIIVFWFPSNFGLNSINFDPNPVSNYLIKIVLLTNNLFFGKLLSIVLNN